MTSDYRKGYSKLQAEERRRQSEVLQRFREVNPEAYERLLKRAQEEVEVEKTMSPLERLQARRPVTTTSRGALTTEEIDKIVYNPKERHYYVHTKDEYGKEHLYFESFVPTPSSDEVLDELREKHPSFSGQLISIEACTCPACLKRHPN